MISDLLTKDEMIDLNFGLCLFIIYFRLFTAGLVYIFINSFLVYISDFMCILCHIYLFLIFLHIYIILIYFSTFCTLYIVFVYFLFLYTLGYIDLFYFIFFVHLVLFI